MLGLGFRVAQSLIFSNAHPPKSRKLFYISIETFTTNVGVCVCIYTYIYIYIYVYIYTHTYIFVYCLLICLHLFRFVFNVYGTQDHRPLSAASAPGARRSRGRGGERADPYAGPLGGGPRGAGDCFRVGSRV